MQKMITTAFAIAFLAFPKAGQAEERRGFFQGGTAYVCDGTPMVRQYTLSQLMPGVTYPAKVIEVGVVFHAGTSPREGLTIPLPGLLLRSTPIGGFFTIALHRPEGTTLLLAGLVRELYQRWTFAIPTIIQEGEVITANWSCQGYIEGGYPITLQPDFWMAIGQ